MEHITSVFVEALKEILSNQLLSVHLYGSCVMDDFREGWSDIDVLCFTSAPLTDLQANKLLYLRQELVLKTASPLFRAIEGAVLCANEFRENRFSSLIYWGTKGERIANQYSLDVFSRYSLLHHGKCIYGKDLSSLIPPPDFPQMLSAIHAHLSAIRTHARVTNDSLYSCGWMLDIARCLYTLRHQSVISKTDAGIWALEQHLCPEPHQMKQTLILRQTPSKRANDPSVKDWLRSLGPSVQRFADVLEKELMKLEPQ